MAGKKTENQSVNLDVAEENETVAEITVESNAADAPAVPKEKMVKRRLFKDNDKYQADVFVCVNGKAYTIKRGVDVEIPEEVAEVLDNADDQLMVAAQKMDELTYRDPK
jgi:hypothetical protein|nr:MAG TPA: hypothetical protein [Caudoviricetes sp.]